MKRPPKHERKETVMKTHGGHHVIQDRPEDDWGQGTYPVSALTRADKIYLFQHAMRYSNFAALVLKGSRGEINNVINAVGSGSVGVNGEAQIDPYDGRGDNDVSAQVTPAFKAVVDAAAAPLEANREAAAEAAKAAAKAAREAHAGWHAPKHGA